MEYEPQPVPPIYQPEVAADAIHYAAHHKRREIYVANSTIQTVVGNKIAPGFLDHFLARAAFEGQYTKQPRDPNRPYNLFEPVPRDFGTHGPFDDRAHKRDLPTVVTKRLGAAGTRGLLLLIAPLWLAFGVLPNLINGLRRPA